eukprot:GGOE01004449.1.p1 GENE.GGOE01004449.1~~GGOE01004449.1.p1  ORF type:complete len:968 (-),score=163.25 GGOE01004449.1:357-3224(-)
MPALSLERPRRSRSATPSRGQLTPTVAGPISLRAHSPAVTMKNPQSMPLSSRSTPRVSPKKFDTRPALFPTEGARPQLRDSEPVKGAAKESFKKTAKSREEPTESNILVVYIRCGEHLRKERCSRSNDLLLRIGLDAMGAVPHLTRPAPYCNSLVTWDETLPDFFLFFTTRYLIVEALEHNPDRPGQGMIISRGKFDLHRPHDVLQPVEMHDNSGHPQGRIILCCSSHHSAPAPVPTPASNPKARPKSVPKPQSLPSDVPPPATSPKVQRGKTSERIDSTEPPLQTQAPPPPTASTPMSARSPRDTSRPLKGQPSTGPKASPRTCSSNSPRTCSSNSPRSVPSAHAPPAVLAPASAPVPSAPSPAPTPSPAPSVPPVSSPLPASAPAAVPSPAAPSSAPVSSAAPAPLSAPEPASAPTDPIPSACVVPAVPQPTLSHPLPDEQGPQADCLPRRVSSKSTSDIHGGAPEHAVAHDRSGHDCLDSPAAHSSSSTSSLAQPPPAAVCKNVPVTTHHSEEQTASIPSVGDAKVAKLLKLVPQLTEMEARELLKLTNGSIKEAISLLSNEAPTTSTQSTSPINAVVRFLANELQRPTPQKPPPSNPRRSNSGPPGSRPPPAGRSDGSQRSNVPPEALVAQVGNVLPHVPREQIMEALTLTNLDPKAAVHLLLDRAPPPKSDVDQLRKLMPHLSEEQADRTLRLTDHDMRAAVHLLLNVADDDNPRREMEAAIAKRLTRRPRDSKPTGPQPPNDFPAFPSEEHLRAQERMVGLLDTLLSPQNSIRSDGELSPSSSHSQELPAREVEILLGKERLEQRLRKLGLEEVVMVDDGHCQFRALSHQLCGSSDHHEWVRGRVVDHLSRNKDEYKDYLVGGTQSEEYLDDMADDGWGDEITLKGFADAFGAVVHVVMSTANSWHQKWEPSCIAARSRHVVLSYLFPVHYNAVMPTPSSPTAPHPPTK